MQLLLFEEVAVAIEARDLGTRPQPNYSLPRPLTKPACTEAMRLAFDDDIGYRF